MRGIWASGAGLTPHAVDRTRTVRGRRCALALATASLAIALPGIAGANEDPPGVGPVPPDNIRELAALNAPDVSSPAERAASETAYTDTSPAEAAVLAEDSFPELLDTLGQGPLPADTEVIDYRGKFGALVETAAGETALADSMTPLQVRDGEELVPVDLSLEPTADGYVPIEPTTEATLPSDLDQGIEVGEAGVELSVADAEGAGEPRPIADGGGVLYPEVAPDVDLVAGMTVAGLQLAAVFRSPATDEITVPLELPAGGELRPTSDGGAEVRVDGEAVAAISPALAFDADRRPVAAEVTIDGDALVFSIDTDGAELHWPVALDPLVTEGWDWNWPAPGNYYNWFFEPFASAGTQHQLTGLANFAPQNGLWIKSYPGNYPQNTHGAWSYRVPHSQAAPPSASPNPGSTSAYITDAQFGPYYHYGAFSGQSTDTDWSPFLAFCTVDVVTNTCIINGAGPASVYGPGNINGGGSLLLRNIANHPEAERVTVDHPSDTSALPGLYLGSERWTQMGGFSVAMSDGEVPTISATNQMNSGGPLPSGWTDRTDAATTTVTGSDNGLGVNQLRLYLGCDANRQNCAGVTGWYMPPQGSTSGGCYGTRASVCPQTPGSRQSPYSLASIPEGFSFGFAEAVDPLGKVSSHWQASWAYLIDRSPPQVQTPGGSLYDNRAAIDGDISYTLNLSATDGNTASPIQMRSGVRKLEVFVDSEATPRYTVTRDCTTPNGSCPLNPDVTPDAVWQVAPDTFSEGTHTVRIIATDMLGHSTPPGVQTFQINVGAYDDAPVQFVEMCGATADSPDPDLGDALMQAVDPEILDELATDFFGGRYGEGWITDASCPSMSHVAVRDLQPGEAQAFQQALAADGRISPARVAVDSVQFTEDRLNTEAGTALSILAQHGVDPGAVSFDVKAQRIEVYASALTQQVRDQIDAAVDPLVVYIVSPSYVGVEYLGATRFDYPPMEAGLALELDPFLPGYECTSGFNVISDSGNLSGTTAGHCAALNDSVGVGVHTVGDVVERDTIFDDADTLRFVLPQGEGSRRIHTGQDRHRGVTAMIQGGGFDIGRRLCWEGATTATEGGPHCARIERKFKGAVSGTTDLVCLRQTMRHGDSGGPVYDQRPNRTARIAGMVTLRHEGMGCFTKVGNALRELGTNLAMRGQ